MNQTWVTGVLILACLIGGCQTESERLADMSRRTVEMQSQQNTAAAKTQEQITQLNRDIQIERQQLTEAATELEQQRQVIHRQRRWELAWAETFRFLAIVMAAVMPLVLCAYLIWAATRNTSDNELVNDFLIREMVSDRPRLLAGPNKPAIETQEISPATGQGSLIQSSKKENETDVTHCAD